MIEIVWEFVVKEEARDQFELAYGPGGLWSKLFAQCPGFRGTTLLRDVNNPSRYMTIEIWDSEVQREEILANREAEYAELEAAFADWTESKTELGVFRVLAEGTVRPWSRARRAMRGGAHPRGRRATR